MINQKLQEAIRELLYCNSEKEILKKQLRNIENEIYKTIKNQNEYNALNDAFKLIRLHIDKLED